MPTYPDVANALLEQCSRYRQRLIELPALKAAVWSAAGEIVIPQERSTRDYLQWAEGRLDILEFTVDTDKVFDATLEVVSGIEGRMSHYLSDLRPE